MTITSENVGCHLLFQFGCHLPFSIHIWKNPGGGRMEKWGRVDRGQKGLREREEFQWTAPLESLGIRGLLCAVSSLRVLLRKKVIETTWKVNVSRVMWSTKRKITVQYYLQHNTAQHTVLWNIVISVFCGSPECFVVSLSKASLAVLSLTNFVF